MQIDYLGKDRFEIKTKEAKISLSAEEADIDGFKIDSAGEYERKSVFIEVVPVAEGEEIFILHLESMSLCYLGRVTKVSYLSDDVLQKIGDIDILFVPFGIGGVTSSGDADKLISKIDPRAVVPMFFDGEDEISNFENAQTIKTSTLKIKKADLPEEERIFYLISLKN